MSSPVAIFAAIQQKILPRARLADTSTMTRDRRPRALAAAPRAFAALLLAAVALWAPRVPAQTATGLDFPGSAAVTATPGPYPRTMRFRFTNPHLAGLPIYGPGNAGVTYVWRAYPRRQAGYYTAFFWGNDDGRNDLGTFLWMPDGSADSYYGAHPYPNPAPSGTNHKWEISIEQGDYLNGDVVYDRWFTQVLRVWVDAQGRKHHEFFWDWPATDPAHVVERISAAAWGTNTPPAPALTWGDAPWAPGNEVWNGVLRGLQIYASALSGPDIAGEIAQPGSTAAGQASIWYLNLNPTPADISDKSGRGHHPAWVGPLRPTLWAGGPVPTTPPAAPTNLSVRPGQ